MSHWLPLATVAIEDRRFWHHGALDYEGIARAALADLRPAASCRARSTITQQLVRDRYLGGERMTLAPQARRGLPRRPARAPGPSAGSSRPISTRSSTATRPTGPRPRRGRTSRARRATSRSPRRRCSPGSRRRRRATTRCADPAAALARRATRCSPRCARSGTSRPRREHRARAGQPLGLRPGGRYAPGPRARRSSARRRASSSRRYGAGARPARRAARADDARPAPSAPRDRGDRRPGSARPSARRRRSSRSTRAPGRSARWPRDPGAAQAALQPRTTRAARPGSAFKVFTLAAALEPGIPLELGLARAALADDPRPAVPQRQRGVDGAQLRRRGERHHDPGAGDRPVGQHDLRPGRGAGRAGAHRRRRAPDGRALAATPVCSITLGPEGVSPLEMTSAFATLAAGGVRHTPTMLERVTRPDGTAVALAGAPGRRARCRRRSRPR